MMMAIGRYRSQLVAVALGIVVFGLMVLNFSGNLYYESNSTYEKSQQLKRSDFASVDTSHDISVTNTIIKHKSTGGGDSGRPSIATPRPEVSLTNLPSTTDLSKLLHSNNNAQSPPVVKDLMTSKMICNSSFPLKCDMYPFVRYWNNRFRPNDCFESSLRPKSKHNTPWIEQKYLVFQPDLGGWNNIRMAAETMIILAHATGRTLVLPPAQVWYLLWKNNDFSDNMSNFHKFFDLSKLSESMNIITMEEFLEYVGKSGKLKQTIPPNQHVQFVMNPIKNAWDYINKACYMEDWTPDKKFMAFNISTNNPTLFGTIDTNNPRYQEMIVDRRTMRIYDQSLHNEMCLFFPGTGPNRMLVHYYAYLYWADEKIAKQYKRLVRDRLRYHDSIFCAAGEIVKLLHQESSLMRRGRSGPITSLSDGPYFAAHIRRGDFQYKETRLTAHQLWQNIQPLLNPNISRILYIATDDKNISFFQPFYNNGFVIRFFDDYYARARLKFPKDVNMNHIGMIEQVICANSHTFIGTPYSTFTGYITRMRGYYRDGRYARTYYTMKPLMNDLQRRPKLSRPLWAREFEVAHKDADDYWMFPDLNAIDLKKEKSINI